MTMMRKWVLRQRPTGTVGPADLELVDAPIPALADGEILVRVLYLSIDPTNRIWMSDRDQYMPPVAIGDTMRGGTTAVVEASRSDRFKVGDLVSCMAGWASHAVVDAAMVRPLIRHEGLPITANMSILGATGITAWFGMCEIGRPSPGETVVVSAAAGAVGSVAAQIAKIRGARVVGIAGGAQKCAWLTQDCGLDGAIDYKNEDVAASLDRLCPDGIDVDFENVGGPIMEAVFDRMNDFGRMALCGMISTYNDGGDISGPRNFGRILMHKLLIKGFIVSDYLPRFGEALAELVPWVQQGLIQWRVHVDQGLEGAPQSLERLFSGHHDGKLLVQVSPES